MAPIRSARLESSPASRLRNAPRAEPAPAAPRHASNDEDSFTGPSPARAAKQSDVEKIGAALGDKPPPQQFWNDCAVDMTLARGVEQKGIEREHLAANDAIGKTALGLDAQGADPKGAPAELTAVDLAGMLRTAGVPLEKQDPAQLQAATRYLNAAKDREEQGQRIYKTLGTFNVLDTIGAPKLTQAESAEVVKQSTGIAPGALLDKKMADPAKRAQAVQELALAVNRGGGEVKLKVGDYQVKLKVGENQQVEKAESKKPGFWSKAGSVMKKVGKIALTVASVIPSPIMPLAIAVNAAISAAKAIKNKNWLGAVVGIAGAFAGGVSALGANIASKGVQAAASVMDKVSRIGGGLQSTMNAVKARSAGGVLSGLAGAVGGAAGLVKNGAGSAATALNRTADRLQRAANVVNVGEAVKNRNFGAAAEGAVALAGGAVKSSGTQKALKVAASGARMASAARSGDVGQLLDAAQSLRATVGGPRRAGAPAAAPSLPGGVRNVDAAMFAQLPQVAGPSAPPAPLLQGRVLSLGLAQAAPVVKSDALTRHTIVKNDRLETLAVRYGVTVKELEAANPGVRAAALKPGTALVVPLVTNDAAGVAALQRFRQSGTNTRTADAMDLTTVERGMSLKQLLRDNPHLTEADLRALNPQLAKDGALYAGQQLVVPGAEQLRTVDGRRVVVSRRQLMEESFREATGQVRAYQQEQEAQRASSLLRAARSEVEGVRADERRHAQGGLLDTAGWANSNPAEKPKREAARARYLETAEAYERVYSNPTASTEQRLAAVEALNSARVDFAKTEARAAQAREGANYLTPMHVGLSHVRGMLDQAPELPGPYGAASQRFALGVAQGALNAVDSTAGMIAHPLDTVRGLTQLAVKAGETTHAGRTSMFLAEVMNGRYATPGEAVAAYAHSMTLGHLEANVRFAGELGESLLADSIELVKQGRIEEAVGVFVGGNLDVLTGAGAARGAARGALSTAARRGGRLLGLAEDAVPQYRAPAPVRVVETPELSALREELVKPHAKRDYDKILELAPAHFRANGIAFERVDGGFRFTPSRESALNRAVDGADKPLGGLGVVEWRPQKVNEAGAGALYHQGAALDVDPQVHLLRSRMTQLEQQLREVPPGPASLERRAEVGGQVRELRNQLDELQLRPQRRNQVLINDSLVLSLDPVNEGGALRHELGHAWADQRTGLPEAHIGDAVPEGLSSRGRAAAASEDNLYRNTSVAVDELERYWKENASAFHTQLRPALARLEQGGDVAVAAREATEALRNHDNVGLREVVAGRLNDRFVVARSELEKGTATVTRRGDDVLIKLSDGAELKVRPKQRGADLARDARGAVDDLVAYTRAHREAARAMNELAERLGPSPSAAELRQVEQAVRPFISHDGLAALEAAFREAPGARSAREAVDGFLERFDTRRGRRELAARGLSPQLLETMRAQRPGLNR